MNKSFGSITVDVIKEGYKTQKGINQAQLRQLVTTEYPSARVGNSFTVKGLFDVSEFNLVPGESYESCRMAWVDVPAGTTVEQVIARLDTLPNARIGVVYSHKLEDTLSAEQQAAVVAGLTDMDTLYESHVVRNRDGVIVSPVTFKTTFFADKAVEDIDLRPQTIGEITQMSVQANALEAVLSTVTV